MRLRAPRTARPKDDRERGATATELAVLMPVLIILVLIPVQVGLWWHAKQAAVTAAGEALDAAQVENASPANGHAGATAILSQAGNLESVTIAVDRSATTVTVTVSGELGFSLFPGAWDVTAHAEGEIERFVPVGER